MFLDVNHRAIRAGNHRLAGRTGEPINHRAAHDEAQNDLRLHDGKALVTTPPNMFSSSMMMPNTMVVAPTDRGADQHGLGRGLERIPRAVALFQLILGILEIRVETEFTLDLFFDALFGLQSGSIHRPIGRCPSPGRSCPPRWSPDPCRGSRMPPNRTRKWARQTRTFQAATRAGPGSGRKSRRSPSTP